MHPSLLLIWLVACGGDEKVNLDETGQSAGQDLIDADGDGYLSTVDCDDQDPGSYPSASDAVGDGVDQNCDGVDGVDGGGGTSGIVDADNDGATSTVDCDESDPSIHPGATDTPGDGIDQNCDGSDAAPSAEADADGDGWASEAFGGPDCNDQDASINPDAPETVGDGKDNDCDGADYGVSGLNVGDLVITEIMYDPDAIGDSEGEWFEIYNSTVHSINLLDLLVADDALFGAADVFTVEENLVAQPGDRLVFAVNGDSTLNGGITADYDYAGRGVNLSNGADDIFIGVSRGGSVTTIDSVSYDELANWPLAKGFSIELNDNSVNTTANNMAANWCLATGRAGSTTDKGSPGAASSGC